MLVMEIMYNFKRMLLLIDFHACQLNLVKFVVFSGYNSQQNGDKHTKRNSDIKTRQADVREAVGPHIESIQLGRVNPS